MRYAVYTLEGYEYGTPYGVYETEARAIEVRNWLTELGNVALIKKVEG
jgi:hypothetical protein